MLGKSKIVLSKIEVNVENAKKNLTSCFLAEYYLTLKILQILLENFEINKI